MGEIQILNCTLRDGGHLTEGNFGETTIRHVIKKLVDANVDIIEVGFLMDKEYSSDYARFKTIADVKRILPEDRKNSKFSLMADFVDLSALEPYDGTIDFIRLSFKRFRLSWALKTARVLMEKGYKVIINPVNCNVYTDQEYLEVLQRVNELHPYGFSIVDTFGVLRLRDLSRLYYLVDCNLSSDIHVGVHLHENLGLAYSLTQHFISINEGKRDIVIDSSLFGMGRTPGNLCIEQIMDHLNLYYDKHYNIEPALDAIDDCIMPIKKMIPWGYSLPYALSAKYLLHRTYAEFLLNKWKIHTSDIERILAMVSRDEAELFNEEYIERLYRNYISISVDDSCYRENLHNEIKDRLVVAIAPGSSISLQKEEIRNYIREHNAFVISIHFIPDFVDIDYAFYTNIKRYEMCNTPYNKEKLMISSNLMRYDVSRDCKYVFDYKKLVNHGGTYCDDSTLMLFNLLKSLGVGSLAIAGFDGFNNAKSTFYKQDYQRNIDFKKVEITDHVLSVVYNDINVIFLTESKYDKNFIKED